MAFRYRSTVDIPVRGEIFSCRWELTGSGSVVRPVLVAGTADYIDPARQDFVAVTVYYGTSQFPLGMDLSDQLVIEGDEVQRCGLTTRTRFSLNDGSRQDLIWSYEHFAAPRYSVRSDPYIGTISDEALAEFHLKTCLRRRR